MDNLDIKELLLLAYDVEEKQIDMLISILPQSKIDKIRNIIDKS